jgi:hypothetical protein
MYFTKFPTYETNIDNKQVTIEDIFTRVAVGKTYAELSSILLPYLVKDGEKIEDIANVYYGDPFYHWVLVLINNITDVRSEWPMTEKALLEKIYDIYDYTVTVSTTAGFSIGDVVSSNTNAKFLITDISESKLIVRYQSGSVYLVAQTLLKKVDSATSTTILSVIDPTEAVHHYEEVLTGYEVSYDASIVQSITELNPINSLQNRISLGEVAVITNLEYEQRTNDAKRAIKLLNNQYLQQFVRNFDAEVSL